MRSSRSAGSADASEIPRATSSTSPARPKAPTVIAMTKAMGRPQIIATWMMSTTSSAAVSRSVCDKAMHTPITATAKQPYPTNGRKATAHHRWGMRQPSAGEDEGDGQRRDADRGLGRADRRDRGLRFGELLEPRRHERDDVAHRDGDAGRASDQPAGREGQQQVDQHREGVSPSGSHGAEDLDLVLLHPRCPEGECRGDHEPAGQVVRTPVPGDQPGHRERGDRDDVDDGRHAGS